MIKVHLGIKRASGRYDSLPYGFETKRDFEEFQDKLIAKGDKLIGIKTIKYGMVLELRDVAMLYKCNVWHTQESRELLAVCHNVNTCIGLANEKAITEGNVLDKECIYQLESMLQTQSYNGDGEFIIVKEPLNKLL